MPTLPVAEHRAPCAQLIREQDGRARIELLSCLPHMSHQTFKVQGKQIAGVAVLL